MLSKVFCSYKFHCPRQLGRDGCFVERVSSESKDPCGQPHVWYQGIYRELTLKMQISGRLSSQSGMFLIGKICWFVLDDVLKTYLPHFSSTLKGIHDFGGGEGGGRQFYVLRSCWNGPKISNISIQKQNKSFRDEIISTHSEEMQKIKYKEEEKSSF